MLPITQFGLIEIIDLAIDKGIGKKTTPAFLLFRVFDLGKFYTIRIRSPLGPAAAYFKENAIAVGAQHNAKAVLPDIRKIALFFLLDHGIDPLAFFFLALLFACLVACGILCKQADAWR